ncbi:hypothetical protein D3C81_1201740 [compost metagenome]
MAGSRRITSSKVPWRFSSPLSERGNSSYQLAKRAARRSASTGITVGWRLMNGRPAGVSMAACMAVPVRGESRISSRRASSPAAAFSSASSAPASGMALPSGVSSVAATSRAPSSISSVTSTPALRFLPISSSQLAKVSRHASTVNSWRPSATIGKLPRQRSLMTGSIGEACQTCSPGARHSTAAASLSWPSIQISAVTSTRSPTVRRTAKRPWSAVGARFSMATRGACMAVARSRSMALR